MTQPNLILVGCVSKKRAGQAPASAIYDSHLWKLRRAWARERSDRFGVPWGVLSAKLGILRPSELVQSYDMAHGDWTEEQKARFEDRIIIGLCALASIPLCGPTPVLPEDFIIEVHAGAPYVTSLRRVVRGGTIFHPVEGLQIGEQLAWYKRHLDRPLPIDMERLRELEQRIAAAEIRAARAEDQLDKIQRSQRAAIVRRVHKDNGQEELVF